MEIKKQIFNFNRIEHLISFKQNYLNIAKNKKSNSDYDKKSNLKKL